MKDNKLTRSIKIEYMGSEPEPCDVCYDKKAFHEVYLDNSTEDINIYYICPTCLRELQNNIRQELSRYHEKIRIDHRGKRNKDIVNDFFLNGLSYFELGRKYNLSTNQVRKIIKDHENKYVNSVKDDPIYEQLVNEYGIIKSTATKTINALKRAGINTIEELYNSNYVYSDFIRIRGIGKRVAGALEDMTFFDSES